MGSPMAEIAERQKAYLNQSATLRHEIDKELACLVQTDGWKYAQRVALEIQQEFNCKPTDPNWQVLTTIQYAYNRLFDECRVRAKQAESRVIPGQSILAEIKENHADNGRGNTSDTARRSASSRRASSRK